MPRIRAAVCTNRSPAAVAECLTALGAQGAGDGLLLVLSATGGEAAAAHAAQARRLTPGAAVLSEPRPGLSHARNRALQACADGEVVAFVDDDAIVASGWLDRLRARWADAPAQVACIGGPIWPRFPDGRPVWLSDTLLGAVTVLDYGPEVLDLDPFRRTVYGANVSFRCGPARAAGGFDPRLGHRGEELWFSEEDELQRLLARAGHGVRYVPDAAVWHLLDGARLTRGALVRRRFRYGATLGARGARSRRLAVRQGVRSAAGAPLAALRGDQARAMERTVRAAENAGVLIGPGIARRR